MKHVSVLLNETIESLNIKPDGIYVDLTLGGGGHSEKILENLSDKGFLYAFDQDQTALDFASKRLERFNNKKLIKANFKDMKETLINLGVTKVDGIIMDLGMSSFQIDEETRGFSYMVDGPLDMRMDKDNPKSAYEILNTYDVEQLGHIFKVYGEESNAYKIARAIIKERPLNTTFDLVKITDKFKSSKGHSAKKVFQALRIYINDEVSVLEKVLPDGLSMLNKDGVIAAITFHSLEDRIVKHFFKEHVEEKVIPGLPTLPKEMPLRYYNRKPILPSKEEMEHNTRSKSAKLRVVVKN